MLNITVSQGLHRYGNPWSKFFFLILLGAFGLLSIACAQNSAPSSSPKPVMNFWERQSITFEQVFLEQGLSQSIVKCIFQDRRGFMWFGTEDGLNKYDGYRFTILKHDPEDSNSLSYNDITSICGDQQGFLWIGTFYGGLNRYDPENEQFVRYQHNPDDPYSLSHNNINSIHEDRSGVLWIGTDNGLNKLVLDVNAKVPTTFIRYLHEPNNPNSLSHDVVRSIFEDRSGALWVGTDGGLNKFDRESELFTVYRNDPGNPNSLSHNEIYSIFQDKTGVLWIGTNGGGLNKLVPPLPDSSGSDAAEYQPAFIRYQNDPDDPGSLSHDEIYIIFEDHSGVLWIGTDGGGLDIFDRETQTFTNYENDPHDRTSLSYNEVRAIYEDRSGLLWIGTYGGGLDKVDRRKKPFAFYQPDINDPNSLSQDIVWSIYEDESGILWIGTHGGGLNKFDRRKNKWTHYRHNPEDPNSLSNDIVRLVYEDRSGVLWIGTHGGGINKFDRATEMFTSYQNDPDDPNSLSHNEIRAIYQDKSGVLWIGTNGGGLNKLVPAEKEDSPPTFIRYQNDPNDPHSLSNDFARVIYEDLSGLFWIGTQGGGLNKFDRERGIFTRYRADPDDPNSLSNDFIFSIHEDQSGMLWLSTWGGGLNKFDRTRGTFAYYTEKDGLPSDAIYGMLEDSQGNLWLSSNNGISRFNPRDETFRNYSVEDGLQSNEFNGGSFFKSRSGEMFFGGIKGFNAFYPENIKDNPYIPPIVITSFRKLNKEVKLDKPISEKGELELSYKDYVFSFEFAALDYTAPEKNLYAYKMEGLDQDWVYTDSKKRFATYTTLAPGRYTFRVKGSNNDGVWNEEGTAIRIVITPPLWQTWWFRMLSALLALALAYTWFKRRMKNVRLKTELQAAHKAQISIMPQQDPQIEGFDISGTCIPANNVGGDFFDYFWLNQQKTRFGIAIGDVSGKAMESAMTAVMSSGMIYSKVENSDLSIKEIVTRLNRPLFFKTDKKMFIALCLASLDIKTKELTFTNAGLIEPLIKSGGIVEYIETAGSKYPLGLVEDNTYQEKTVHLKTGDVLILLTDGIPEAQNHAKELYGDDRLKTLLETLDTTALSAKEIKEKIIEDARRFSGKAPQHDDVTVIVVKGIG